MNILQNKAHANDYENIIMKLRYTSHQFRSSWKCYHFLLCLNRLNTIHFDKVLNILCDVVTVSGYYLDGATDVVSIFAVHQNVRYLTYLTQIKSDYIKGCISICSTLSEFAV